MSLLITKSGGLFRALFPGSIQRFRESTGPADRDQPARKLEETGFLPEMRKKFAL